MQPLRFLLQNYYTGTSISPFRRIVEGSQQEN